MLNLAFLLVGLSLMGQSQDPALAKKVYYQPFPETIYFALAMDPVNKDSIRGKNGKIPNTIINLEAELPLYEPDQDYFIGDMLSLFVGEFTETRGRDLYIYNVYTTIKIIGKVDPTSINKKIVTSCDKLFGEGKTEVWPYALIDKKEWGYKPNEKAVESDYYVICKVWGIEPSIYSLARRTSSEMHNQGEAANLIVFQVVNKSNQWGVIETEDVSYQQTKMDNHGGIIKVEIKYKVKAGKPGKKIGSAGAMDLTTKEAKGLSKIVPFEFELDVEEGDYSPRVNAWIEMDKRSAELVEMNQKLIEENCFKAIEKAFSKVK